MINVVAGTIGIIVPMIVDLLHNKSAFALNNGYGADFSRSQEWLLAQL